MFMPPSIARPGAGKGLKMHFYLRNAVSTLSGVSFIQEQKQSRMLRSLVSHPGPVIDSLISRVGPPWVGPPPDAARMPDSTTELNCSLGITFIAPWKFRR